MMIDDYYQARGWTADGLIPRSKLIALGLADVAEDIGVEDAGAGALPVSDVAS
jgi:hypothetical protein